MTPGAWLGNDTGNGNNLLLFILLIPALGADFSSLRSTWEKGGRDELE